MIEWIDKSDKRSRFYIGDPVLATQLSTEDAVRLMLDFLCERILGNGNAAAFDLLMLEVNCDSGRLIAGASTNERWKANQTDGCSIRVQEIQDYWYDQVEAGVTADEFSLAIKDKVAQIGTLFRERIASASEELASMASQCGFTLVVFGSNPGEAVMSETFG